MPFTSDNVCRRGGEVDTAACRPADSPARIQELLQTATVSRWDTEGYKIRNCFSWCLNVSQITLKHHPRNCKGIQTCRCNFGSNCWVLQIFSTETSRASLVQWRRMAFPLWCFNYWNMSQFVLQEFMQFWLFWTIGTPHCYLCHLLYMKPNLSAWLDTTRGKRFLYFGCTSVSSLLLLLPHILP